MARPGTFHCCMACATRSSKPCSLLAGSTCGAGAAVFFCPPDAVAQSRTTESPSRIFRDCIYTPSFCLESKIPCKRSSTCNGNTRVDRTQRFLPRYKLLNPLSADRVTDSRRGWYLNRPIRHYFHLGLDHIFIPIALAGGNISRKHKSRQSGHRNVVGAPDAGFQHPAAPHGSATRPAE